MLNSFIKITLWLVLVVIYEQKPILKILSPF